MAGEKVFKPSSNQDYVTQQQDAYEELIAGGGGATDHGALSGLSDDDHSIYALADGSRGNVSGIQTAHVQLTDAQIIARSDGSARTTIVAAPGAGKSLEVHRAVLITRFAAGAYTNVAADDAQVALYEGFYTVTSKLVNGTFSGTGITTVTSIFANARDALTRMIPDQTITASRFVPAWADLGDLENKALELEIFNGAGLFTGGNAANTLDLIVWRSVLNLATGAVE